MNKIFAGFLLVAVTLTGLFPDRATKNALALAMAGYPNHPGFSIN